MAFTSGNNDNMSGRIDDPSATRNTGLGALGGQGGLNDQSGLGGNSHPSTHGGGITSGGVSGQGLGNPGSLTSHGNNDLGSRGGQNQTFGGVGDGIHSGLPGSNAHGSTTHGTTNSTGKASMGDKVKGTFEEVKGKVTNDPSLKMQGELRKQEEYGSHGGHNQGTCGAVSQSPSSMPGAFDTISHPTHDATHMNSKPSMGEKISAKLTGNSSHSGALGGYEGNQSVAADHDTHDRDTRQHGTHGATNTVGHATIGDKVKEQLSGVGGHSGQHQQNVGGVGENRSCLTGAHNTHGHDAQQHGTHSATNTVRHETMGEKVMEKLTGKDAHAGQHQETYGGVGENRSGLAATHNTHDHDTRQHGTHGATNTAGHATIGDKVKDKIAGNDVQHGQHQHNVGGVGENRSNLTGSHNTHGDAALGHGAHGATNTTGKASIVDKVKGTLEELTGKVTGNTSMQHQGEQRKAGDLSGGNNTGARGVGY